MSLLDPDHCGVSICARKLMPLFDHNIIRSLPCSANGMLEADAARIEFTERPITLMAGRPPPWSEKRPTPGGAVGWGNHARSMGELEEAFPGVWQQGLDLD